MFCDITWGAGGSTADLTLDIAVKMQNMARAGGSPVSRGGAEAAPQVCVETMMHLTCTNMPRESLKAALDKARGGGRAAWLWAHPLRPR